MLRSIPAIFKFEEDFSILKTNENTMKTSIIVFFLSISSAFAQVDCNRLEANFSGKCESYNEWSGIRSSYSYKKGNLHGKFEELYKNGQLRSSGAYKKGFLHGKFNAFYATGEQMTSAKFKSGSGDFAQFHENGVNKVRGQFEDGKAVGNWQFFNSNGEMTREMDMANARVNMHAFLVGVESVRQPSMFDDFFGGDGGGFTFSFGGDMDSTFAQMRMQMNESMKRMQAQMDQMMQGFSDTSFSRSFQFDTTFTFNGFDDFDGFFNFKSFGDSSNSFSFHFDTIIGGVPNSQAFFGNKRDLVDFPDTDPSYVGGEEAMKAFIEREMNASGVDQAFVAADIFIEAIIEKDGSVSNARVAMGVENEAQNAEALRIAKAMPSWNPATVDGEPVRSRCIIPIKFP